MCSGSARFITITRIKTRTRTGSPNNRVLFSDHSEAWQALIPLFVQRMSSGGEKSANRRGGFVTQVNQQLIHVSPGRVCNPPGMVCYVTSSLNDTLLMHSKGLDLSRLTARLHRHGSTVNIWWDYLLACFIYLYAITIKDVQISIQCFWGWFNNSYIFHRGNTESTEDTHSQF